MNLNPAQQINRVFLLATAPFFGMLVWLLCVSASQLMPQLSDLDKPAALNASLTEQAAGLNQKLDAALSESTSIKSTIEKFLNIYTQSANDVNAMLKSATASAAKPGIVFENRVAGQFGKPIRTASSGNIDLKLYSFSDKNYKGYALKADLKSDKAMRMILGKDKIGSGETTLAVANRYGAVAGVNAGGFADDNSGKRYPTGTTVYEGKYVYGFFPSQDDMTFVGMSKDRKLIGGKFTRQSDLDALNPLFGASFVPTLLKNGKKVEIPGKWQSSPYRAPRSVIGSFSNDQVFVIVTEGYDERGGSGASLAELQDRMQSIGIRDAYNLDGGGSSTLIWNGEVINSPSDGRMRAMPTHFLFFK